MNVDPEGTDAVLFTVYDSNYGLPIVGHSALLIEYKGLWYFTEYSRETKKDASVSISLGYSSIDDFYNIPFYSYLSKSNVTRTKLTGDYSESYLLASQYADSNSDKNFGTYNLLFNNCLDYTQTILKAGSNANSDVQRFINNPNSGFIIFDAIPAVFDFRIKIVKTISKAKKIIKRLWRKVFNVK